MLQSPEALRVWGQDAKGPSLNIKEKVQAGTVMEELGEELERVITGRMVFL